MKHNISELYRIEGQQGTYSEDYLDKYFVKTAPKAYNAKQGEACRLMYKTNKNGMLNVHTANGVKVVYMIGEKTWFDTEEERDNARIANKHQQEVNAHRRELMAKLDKLSTANLEKLVAKLGL